MTEKAKKKAAPKKTKRSSTKTKNSLVANINRRKRSGKSRPKSRSTIAKKAYAEMEAGWPSSKTSRA